MTCPCGSGKEYIDCCQSLINDQQIANTAEQLMRSRYTAYSLNNIDYIIQTMRGNAAKDFDADSARLWASQVTWQGLEIIRTNSFSEKCATVEFIARYISQGKPCFIYENSEFLRIDGLWYYVAGQHITPGRNDFCPCGSGKKFKKCCT